jgi:hypothetical protein
MSQNDGKYLERAVEQYLQELKRIDVTYLRLPDSRAARNLISAQPADFLISSKRAEKPFLLECKSKGVTSKNGIFKFDKKFQQYPFMLRWRKAGTPGYIIAHWWKEDALQYFPIEALDEADGFVTGYKFADLPILMKELLCL